MKFLETITAMGDDILIPIDKIKFISFRYETGWTINIIGYDDIELSEHFGDNEEKATKRYEMIKKIIDAA